MAMEGGSALNWKHWTSFGGPDVEVAPADRWNHSGTNWGFACAVAYRVGFCWQILMIFFWTERHLDFERLQRSVHLELSFWPSNGGRNS
jgi:hypothetical protein